MTTGAGAALLEEALAAFAFIVQSSADAIYQVDHTGRIITWNPGAARMSGHPDADVIGNQHVILFPAHRRSAEADVLRRALLGERIERRETELARPDGLLVPVELTASPIFDGSGRVVGASVIAHDITEQRLAQDFLAESQARLQEAQELANVGMWTWDIRTDSVQYSEPLYRILHVDPHSFSGAFDELIGCVVPDQREDVRAALRAGGRTGDPVRLECGVIRVGDDDGWVSIRAEAERASGGEVVGLRGIVQDLTERHRAELAVRDALARERQAAEQLRAADRLKDEFLSTVSHELRTPLTSIIGLVGLLVDGGDHVEGLAPDLARRIQRNAEEMRGMIERLLDFSRLEAGRVVLRPTQVALRTVVDQSLLQADLALAEHQTVVDVATDLTVVADLEAMTRVLVNLLTNAAKFSPLGSAIHIAARPEPPDLIVSVRNDGVGLDAATARRVFERFFQVEDDQRAGKRGTGVGLSIVQRYVEMHGGRVWVDSEVGQGATFSFSLPTAGPTAP
jgi:PAS domain S-box-containing protein